MLRRPSVSSTPPAAANLPCLTGSSAQGGVPNSFVLPVHSCVPLMLLHEIVVPWCDSLRLPALSFLLNLHSCHPAPLDWRTLPGYRVSLSGCRRLRIDPVHPQLLRIILCAMFQDGIEYPDQLAACCDDGLLDFERILLPDREVLIHLTELLILLLFLFLRCCYSFFARSSARFSTL